MENVLHTLFIFYKSYKDFLRFFTVFCRSIVSSFSTTTGGVIPFHKEVFRDLLDAIVVRLEMTGESLNCSVGKGKLNFFGDSRSLLLPSVGVAGSSCIAEESKLGAEEEKRKKKKKIIRTNLPLSQSYPIPV